MTAIVLELAATRRGPRRTMLKERDEARAEVERLAERLKRADALLERYHEDSAGVSELDDDVAAYLLEVTR